MKILTNPYQDRSFNEFAREKINFVRSQAKLMLLMTQSQLNNVAIDCGKLTLEAHSISEATFREFFDQFLEPFHIKILEKDLSVNIEEFHGHDEKDDF